MKDNERIIKKMPDLKTLQEFINGFHRPCNVVFNIEKGEFEWLDRKEKDGN